MAVSIEDILLARAAADEANRPTTEQAVVAGALLGSGLGVGAGAAPHAVSQGFRGAKRALSRLGGGSGEIPFGTRTFRNGKGRLPPGANNLPIWRRFVL